MHFFVMRRWASALVAALILLAVAAPAEGKKYAVKATTDSFDSLVGDGPALIFFHAPWCGHCKKFAPVYEKAAKALDGHTKLIKVDATANRGLGSRFAVKGYPTLFHVKDGEVRRFAAGQSKQGVIDFAKGGWRSVTPQDWFWSPMGPYLKIRGGAMSFIASFASLHVVLAEALGIPDLIAGFILLLTTVMAACSGLILTAAWLGDDRRPPPGNTGPKRDVRGVARAAAAKAGKAE